MLIVLFSLLLGSMPGGRSSCARKTERGRREGGWVGGREPREGGRGRREEG
jgi:hypothetical protein